MKRSSKIAIILCSVLVVFAITGFLIVKKYLSPNETITEQEEYEVEEEQQEKVVEFLVATTVNCEINTTAQISYLVNNCENYSVTFSISDMTIAEIDSVGKITPKMIGNTQVTATLNYDEKQIVKTCSLTVYSNTNTCELDINCNTQNVEYLMKNQEYLVKISRDCHYKTVGNLVIQFENYFNLLKSGDDFLLEKLSDDYRIVTYKFVPYKSGKYNFSFVDDYFNKELTITCYSKTEEILVQTNYAKNISENNYKIYMFDTLYSTEANLDGYFNYALVTMSQNIDSNETLSFEFNINNDLDVGEHLDYSLSDNVLTVNPKKPCNFTLIVSSSKSNVTKIINFCVEKIYADKILFNGEEYLVAEMTEKTIEVEKDIENDFVLSKNIVYSIGDVLVETEGLDVVISNGEIKISNYGTCNVFVKYNSVVVLKLTYKVLNDYYFKIDEDSDISVMPGDSYTFVKHTKTEVEINVHFSMDFKAFNLTYFITNSKNDDTKNQTSKFCNSSYVEQKLPANWEFEGNNIFMYFSESQFIEFSLVSNYDESVYLKVKINLI